MIELRDVVVAACAFGGAIAGVRVDIRSLWNAVRDLRERVMRLESKTMKVEG